MIIRRLKESLENWFGSTGDNKPGEELSVGRRRFFQRAAVGAASIGGVAGGAKVVVDSLPDPDLQSRYAQTAHKGEQELQAREYVVMSEHEKAAMLEELVASHENHRS